MNPKIQQILDQAAALSDVDLYELTQELDTLCSNRIAENKEEFNKAVFDMPGNDTCADCSSKEGLCWASVNIGVVLCHECAGAHRGLGAHISKPRSLNLDIWTNEQKNEFLALGNEAVNNIYEFQAAPVKLNKPKPNSPLEHKEAFIDAKYKNRAFTAQGDGRMPKWITHSNSTASIRSQIHTGVVLLRVIRATNLESADINGSSDPFVKVRCGKYRTKTKVVRHTLNPEWNENLQLQVDSIHDVLRFKVRDYDFLVRDDPLGEAAYDLTQIVPNKEQLLKLPLAGVNHGILEVAVTFVPMDKR
eukprot:c16185_g1_i1.p1 GENE.c16185_g1_i1~~c16185_g1_i1.p1  ORF type:complete len:304 (+),score=77.35 c16185_g1_i1:66-977(+)